MLLPHVHRARFFSFACREVVTNGKTLVSVQKAADAARKDGLRTTPVEELAGMGAGGKHRGNLSRDFERATRRRLGEDLLRTYDVTVPFHHYKLNHLVPRQHPIFLPHEVYGYMARRPDAFARRVLGSKDGRHARAWWESCSSEIWYSQHPARHWINAGHNVTPVRLYGDDVEHVKKGDSCLVLSWSASHLSIATVLSRFLITVLPLVGADAMTHQAIYEIVMWSFGVLLSGRYPTEDPWGDPWSNDPVRRRLGGQPLDPTYGSRGALAQLAGDWKWIKECMGFKDHFYGARKCCHECNGVKHGPGPSAYDFEEDAAWADTVYSFADFLRDCKSDLPALALIPGFHLLLIVVDFMHVLHLGVLASALGSQFVLLSERFVFGKHTGKLSERLDGAMHVAFARFSDYCKNNKIGCSQSRFSAARLSVSSGFSWPEFKGKAADNRHITQWLYSVLPEDSPAAELGLFWGLSEMLHLVHSVKEFSFSASQRRRFCHAGRLALRSYAALSKEAAAMTPPRPLWPIKPKLHQLDHSIRRTARTSRKPAWCFSDEDFNRIVVRVVRHCRADGLGKMMLFKWSLRLHRSLEDEDYCWDSDQSSDSE